MKFVLTHKNALIQAAECETRHCFMFLKIVQASAQFQAHDCQEIGIGQTSGQFVNSLRYQMLFANSVEMPVDVFNELNEKPYFQEFMQTELNILIFDPIEKLILEWIN